MRLTEAWGILVRLTEAHLIFFLGVLKNELLMMKKFHFYNVFNNIFNKKCKTVYTFETFFRLPSSTGSPQKWIPRMELCRVIQFGPLEKVNSEELCHTKRSVELCHRISGAPKIWTTTEFETKISWTMLRNSSDNRSVEPSQISYIPHARVTPRWRKYAKQTPLYYIILYYIILY